MSARGGFVVADLVRKASSLLYCPIQFVPVPVLFIIPGARFREPGPDSSISSGEKKSDGKPSIRVCVYIYIRRKGRLVEGCEGGQRTLIYTLGDLSRGGLHFRLRFDDRRRSLVSYLRFFFLSFFLLPLCRSLFSRFRREFSGEARAF